MLKSRRLLNQRRWWYILQAEEFIEQPQGFGVTWLHPCALHPESEGWYEGDDPESVPSCPDCGCMLEVEDCIWGCGANFLSYGDNEFDDIIRSASVNDSGDLMCARCANEEMKEEEQDFISSLAHLAHIKSPESFTLA